MESLVTRLATLTEQDLRSLGSDAQLMSCAQQLNHLIDLKLSQQQQNTNETSNASSSNQNDNDNALDLRVANDNVNFIIDTNIKKPKGEFDEPNLEEVDRRMQSLVQQDNYHQTMLSATGRCACILGSEFRNGVTAQDILTMVDQWRQMPTQQRVAHKWDLNYLPRDIQLNDINRFESLRRQVSCGRANFGGIAKRKPHNIGGTRQFLLILYCIWGHPGRDDPMQREGYCPQCFARIMKLNDQSILVRVVNHFNMKHKRGANPNTNVRPD